MVSDERVRVNPIPKAKRKPNLTVDWTGIFHGNYFKVDSVLNVNGTFCSIRHHFRDIEASLKTRNDVMAISPLGGAVYSFWWWILEDTQPRQHVSAAVVRPKHKVDGTPSFSTPYRIYETWNINTKNRTSQYVADFHMCAKFGYDRSTPFLPTDGWRCQPNSSIPSFLSFPSLLYSCSPVQPKRLDRFLRLIPQNERFGARKCLLYDSTL